MVVCAQEVFSSMGGSIEEGRGLAIIRLRFTELGGARE